MAAAATLQMTVASAYPELLQSEEVLKHIPEGSDTDAHDSAIQVPESQNHLVWKKISKTIESNLWLMITLSPRALSSTSSRLS